MEKVSFSPIPTDDSGEAHEMGSELFLLYLLRQPRSKLMVIMALSEAGNWRIVCFHFRRQRSSQLLVVLRTNIAVATVL